MIILVLVILLLLFVALFRLHLVIDLLAQRVGSDNLVQVTMSVPPLWHKTTKIPITKLVQQSAQRPSGKKAKPPQASQKDKLSSEILAKIIPRLSIQVKKLQIRARIGLGDAADTAIFIGIIWSLWSLLLPVVQLRLEKLSYLAKPSLSIEPVFDKWDFQGQLQCILSLRLGEIIFEGIKGLARWRF